jgi:2-oxoglutarate ferredoxin oxidoreductase subunit alpha
MHRIGGLEKQDVTGNVNYEPENHQKMVHIRARKVALVADDVPLQTVSGPESGDVLVVGWGGTYGSLATAVRRLNNAGHKVAHAHLRYLNPLPRNLGEILGRYKKVLVPELNLGQLRMVLRAEFLIDAIGLNKVKGKPFTVGEVEAKIRELLP